MSGIGVIVNVDVVRRLVTLSVPSRDGTLFKHMAAFVKLKLPIGTDHLSLLDKAISWIGSDVNFDTTDGWLTNLELASDKEGI